MKTYKAVLFDLDGTLLNTIGDLAEAVNAALVAYGYAPYEVAEVQKMVGNGIRKLLERATPQGEDNPKFEEILQYFVDYYMKHVAVKTDYYPGILALVEKLAARGVGMAIVSNKFQAGCEELRERFFATQISVVLGDEAGRQRKPATDAPNLAMQRLDVGVEETLYVGDSTVDAKTAENAGLDYVLVDWGFCPRAELEMWHALEIISDAGDLLKYFA